MLNVTNDMLDDVAEEVSQYLTNYISGATEVTVTPSMVQGVLCLHDLTLLRESFGDSTEWVASLIRQCGAQADRESQVRNAREYMLQLDPELRREVLAQLLAELP